MGGTYDKQPATLGYITNTYHTPANNFPIEAACLAAMQQNPVGGQHQQHPPPLPHPMHNGGPDPSTLSPHLRHKRPRRTTMSSVDEDGDSMDGDQVANTSGYYTKSHGSMSSTSSWQGDPQQPPIDPGKIQGVQF